MSGISSDFRSPVVAQSTKQGVTASLAEAQRQEGSIKGEIVFEPKDATSALLDQAEEIGAKIGEHLEKTLSERKEGGERKKRASAVELAEKYTNMTGDSLPPRKFHAFLDSLKSRGDKATQQELMDLLKREFSDATEQYAAIAFAEEALKNEGGHEKLLATVTAVKETLLKEAGPAIRAGINIAADVLKFASQGLEQIEKLRELYRYAVLGRETVSEMYQAIMSRYGESRFPQALDFLIQAAGNDLDAHGLGPSIEPAHLETAVNNINYVQQMGNLHRVLTELLEKVRPNSFAHAG